MLNDEKYTSVMKILHWFMAFLLLMMIAVGWRMSDLAKDDPMRSGLYDLHKSFGIAVLLLAVIRILVRLKSVKPTLPASVKPIEAKAAKATYAILYGLMIAIPVSGYCMSTLFGMPVKFFGWELPKLLAVDRELGREIAELHELFAYGLLVLVGIHVAGFLKHLLLDKTNLLKRMW